MRELKLILAIGNISNYIEIGGVGTGAKSDKVSGKPIYSNGLLISAGARKQF